MTVTHLSPESIAEIRIFKGLPTEILTEIAATCHTIEVEAGEIIFRQGEPATAFYRIEEGQVHASRRYEEGEDLILNTFSPYDTVGELSMVAQEPRMVTVTAVSDCVLTVFEKQAFFALMDKHPLFRQHILHYTSVWLHHIYVHVHEYALGNAGARLASLLLLMCDHKAGIATTHYHRHQLARAIGADPMWLKTTIENWRARGWIHLEGQTLTVNGVDDLRQIADKI
jgi:CRP-like cAMP-binding protein